MLSTLSAIARGGLDHRDALVRQRCATDADYLRGLISGDRDNAPTELAAGLARLGREQAALGLRVHHMSVPRPPDTPAEVVRALVESAREALNNVQKHADVGEAWLTVTVPDDRIRVTVSDRGRGFEPLAVSRPERPGLGIAGSMVARMREVGGSCVVESVPGQGTSVELTWPT